MAHFLKPYKNEIIAAFIPDKLALKWSKTKFVHRVRFNVIIPETNLRIGFEIGYLVENKLLTAHYTFQAMLKKKPVKTQEFSLTQEPTESILGLRVEAINSFLSTQKVALQNSSIQALTSLYDQLATTLSIFKTSLPSLTEAIQAWSHS